jgi:DinB family protein
MYGDRSLAPTARHAAWADYDAAMDSQTLVAAADFSHARLLGIIEAIEKSGQDVARVLAWRPAPGRAHIGWQLMHCAATHDKYLNVRLRGGGVKDTELVEKFASGTTPSDQHIPTVATIREKLAATFADLRQYIVSLSPQQLEVKQDFPNGLQRSIGESIVLLTWHEAHHQGQIHLTWNMYKAANGIAI